MNDNSKSNTTTVVVGGLVLAFIAYMALTDPAAKPVYPAGTRSRLSRYKPNRRRR